MPRAQAAGEHRNPHVHGPCEQCGVLYYSRSTKCQAICPNCGHQPSCED